MMSMPQLPTFVRQGPRWTCAYGRGPVHVVDADTMRAALTRHSKEYARRDQWDEHDNEKPVPAVALIWSCESDPPAILLLDSTSLIHSDGRVLSAKDGTVMYADHREPAAIPSATGPEGEAVQPPEPHSGQ